MLAASEIEISISQICRRQWEAYSQGSELLLEDVLADFPSLRTDQAALLELIYAEVSLRREFGRTIDRADYLARFPELAEQLQGLLDFDSLLDASQAKRGWQDQPFGSKAALPLTGTCGSVLPVDPKIALPGDSKSVPRFQIVAPYREGGRGKVFIAIDRELNREVALKEIKRDFVHDHQQRAQFLHEACLTGKLEHPGIVPVYSVGEHADGRPYYAMRLIRGRCLREEIEVFFKQYAPPNSNGSTPVHMPPSAYRGRDFRALLSRLIDVCNALAFAHDRGVLHLDLKPANIMLGEYGETLVVDWGLASPLENEQAPDWNPARPLAVASDAAPNSAIDTDANVLTWVGRGCGTPAFMSPEQALGRSDRFSAATDIFGLGGILFQMLTNELPHQARSPGALAAIFSSGGIPSPQSRVPTIPRQLAAICQKALASNPSQRHASPLELADDLENFLADEPVSCHPDGWLVRVQRWGRQHPRIVSSLLATILAVACALGIGSGLLRLKNEQLQIAHQKEQQASAATKATCDRLMATTEALIFDIQNELTQIPAAHQARRAILRQAANSLIALGNQEHDTELTDRYAAVIQSKLADILMEVGDEDGMQGVSRAAENYLEAHANFVRLAQEHPSDLTHQRDLSASFGNLGLVHLRLGQASFAKNHFVAALEISRQLHEERPSLSVARWDLARDLTNIADCLVAQGQLPPALENYTLALQHWELLLLAKPRDLAVIRRLSAALNQAGTAIREAGTGSGVAEFERSLALREQLLAIQPDSLQDQFQLTFSYNRLGDVQYARREFPEALQAYRQALLIRKRLFEADPLSLERKHFLAIAHFKIGRVLLTTGNAAEAEAEFCEAKRMLAKLTEADPSNTQYQYYLALMNKWIGDCLTFQWQVEEATQHYTAALEIRQALLAVDPQNPTLQHDVADGHEELATLARKRGDYQECERQARAGLAMLAGVSQQQCPKSFQKNFNRLETNLQQSILGEMVTSDRDSIHQQPLDQQPELYFLRLLGQCHAEDLRAASQTAQESWEFAESHPDMLLAWRFACATSASFHRELRAQPTLPPELEPHVALMRQRTLFSLRRAIDLGYSDGVLLQTSACFASFRDDPAFLAICQSLVGLLTFEEVE